MIYELFQKGWTITAITEEIGFDMKNNPLIHSSGTALLEIGEKEMGK